MQSLRKCFQSFLTTHKPNISNLALTRTLIHTSPRLNEEEIKEGPRKWLTGNDVVFPPQKPGEERRPAFVCHMKTNIKYSPKAMWYIAVLVRGMSVDEAVKQLSFVIKKGAAIAKETILEAQQMAIDNHNVEFKSNLWVAESFVSKGKTIKGLRRHAKGRRGIIHYRHVHYYVRLEEGKPPKHYYLPEPQNKEQLLSNWLDKMRARKINNTL